MTAISKAWVSIADSAVDPDSPLDTALMTGLRDDLVHLREWLGASFFAGAVQDHNHDGANSSLIEIGPNYVRNGSFESGGTAGWTITQYTGGTVATNTANDMDGATALAFTSSSTANGGGDAIQAAYTSVTGGRLYDFSAVVKASVANVSSKMEVVWYSDALAQISTSTVFSSASTNTTVVSLGARVRAPSNARYLKLRITGGDPGVGSSAGTIYFDGIFGTLALPLAAPGSVVVASSDAEVTTTSTSLVKVKEIVAAMDGQLTIAFDLNGDGGVSDAYGQIYINGSAAGTLRQLNSGYTTETENINVLASDLVQIYAKHGGSGSTYVKNFRLKASLAAAYVVNI